MSTEQHSGLLPYFTELVCILSRYHNSIHLSKISVKPQKVYDINLLNVFYKGKINLRL